MHENKITWRNFVPARQFIRQAEQSFVPGLNHSKFTCLMGGNFSVCARSAHVHIEENQSRMERVKKLCAEVCVPQGLCQPGTLQQHCSLLPQASSSGEFFLKPAFLPAPRADSTDDFYSILEKAVPHPSDWAVWSALRHCPVGHSCNLKGGDGSELSSCCSPKLPHIIANLLRGQKEWNRLEAGRWLGMVWGQEGKGNVVMNGREKDDVSVWNAVTAP